MQLSNLVKALVSTKTLETVLDVISATGGPTSRIALKCQAVKLLNRILRDADL